MDISFGGMNAAIEAKLELPHVEEDDDSSGHSNDHLASEAPSDANTNKSTNEIKQDTHHDTSSKGPLGESGELDISCEGGHTGVAERDEIGSCKSGSNHPAPISSNLDSAHVEQTINAVSNYTQEPTVPKNDTQSKASSEKDNFEHDTERQNLDDARELHYTIIATENPSDSTSSTENRSDKSGVNVVIQIDEAMEEFGPSPNIDALALEIHVPTADAPGVQRNSINSSKKTGADESSHSPEIENEHYGMKATGCSKREDTCIITNEIQGPNSSKEKRDTPKEEYSKYQDPVLTEAGSLVEANETSGTALEPTWLATVPLKGGDTQSHIVSQQERETDEGCLHFKKRKRQNSDDLIDDYDKYSKEITASLEEKTQKLEEMTEQYRNVSMVCTSLESENKLLKANAEDQQTKFNRLHDENNANVQEHIRLKKQLNEKETHYQSRNQQFFCLLNTASKEKTVLQEESLRLKNQVERIGSELAMANQKLFEQREREKTLQRNRDGEIQRMKNELKRKEDEHNSTIKHVFHEVEQERQKLMIEIQKRDEAIHKAKKEQEELLLRYSKLAGETLALDNANVANLSDPYRPTRLAEMFAELYDNEWTDAFEEIEDKEDCDKIEYLLNLLKRIYELSYEMITDRTYRCVFTRHRVFTESGCCTYKQNYEQVSSTGDSSNQAQVTEELPNTFEEEGPDQINDISTRLEEVKVEQAIDSSTTEVVPVKQEITSSSSEEVPDVQTIDQTSGSQENQSNLSVFSSMLKEVQTEHDNSIASTEKSHRTRTIIMTIGSEEYEVIQTLYSSSAKKIQSKQEIISSSSEKACAMQTKVQTTSSMSLDGSEENDTKYISNQTERDHDVSNTLSDDSKDKSDLTQEIRQKENDSNIYQLADKHDQQSDKSYVDIGEEHGDRTEPTSLSANNEQEETNVDGSNRPVREQGSTVDDNSSQSVQKHAEQTMAYSNELIHEQAKQQGQSVCLDDDEQEPIQPKSIRKELHSIPVLEFTDVTEKQSQDIKNLHRLNKTILAHDAPTLQKTIMTVVCEEYGLDEQTRPDVYAFIDKCTELCVQMCLKDPSLYIEFIETGSSQKVSFDTEKYRAYTKKGKYIEVIVWPCLLLHKNGPLLCKGIAQGTK